VTGLPEPPTPRCPYFYKYAGNVDWLEPIIVNSEIYIPTVAELNDPRDARPVLTNLSIERVADFLKLEFRNEHPRCSIEEYSAVAVDIDEGLTSWGPEGLLNFATDRLHTFLDTRRVYCMSKRWDNLAMWAKYANDHRGYCVEFANDGGDTLFATARKVVYSGAITLDFTNIDHATPNWYFYKSAEWSNEEEIRIVCSRVFGRPTLRVFPGVLSRVILGEKMRRDDVVRVTRWATQRARPMSLVMAKFDRRRGQLLLNPLNNAL